MTPAKPKRKEEKAAEKRYPEGTMTEALKREAFLAGVRYGRRTAIEAIKKDELNLAAEGAAGRSEFWKGVYGGYRYAIDSIRKRARQ